jgi:hypothetical protein
MDIVQIDISTKCHLKSSNCTRRIPHQPEREDMELETFERRQGHGRLAGAVGWKAALLRLGPTLKFYRTQPQREMHADFPR